MAPHSSTLAWKIPWMEEPGRLQSMGSAKSQTGLSDFTFTFHFHALEKEMATHSSVIAWRIPGTGNLVGCCHWGCRVGHDWSDLAAAAARYLSETHLWESRFWFYYRLTYSVTWHPVTSKWTFCPTCKEWKSVRLSLLPNSLGMRALELIKYVGIIQKKIIPWHNYGPQELRSPTIFI